MTPLHDPLVLYGESFASRLLLGTSRYPSPQVLADAVRLAQPAMLTASLRRQTAHAKASPVVHWRMCIMKAIASPLALPEKSAKVPAFAPPIRTERDCRRPKRNS